MRNKFISDLYSSIKVKRDLLFGPAKPGIQEERNLPKEIHLQPPDPNNPNRLFIQQTYEQIPKITQKFLSYQWDLAITNQNYFLTSDRPLTFVSQTRLHTGPGNKDAFVLFPILPKVLLIMYESEKKETIRKLSVTSADEAKGFNQIIWSRADRFVLSHDKNLLLDQKYRS